MDADSQERKALEKRHERCVKAQQELESFLAILEKGAWLKRVSRTGSDYRGHASDPSARGSLDEEAVAQEAAAEEAKNKRGRARNSAQRPRRPYAGWKSSSGTTMPAEPSACTVSVSCPL